MRPDRLYSYLRAVQSYFPFARRTKFEAYLLLMRYFGFMIEADFHLLPLLGGVKLAVDVGANWGQSVEALRRMCSPESTICLEPNPLLAGILTSRYAADSTITVLNRAVSDVPGKFQLFVPRYRGFVYDGLASLDKASALEWLNADRVAGFDPSKLDYSEYTIQAVTLDSLNLEPDVVKIDVQGFELQVVKGGARTFSQCHPVTIVESPSDSVVEVLAGYGLQPFRYAEGRLISGDTSGLNTIFLGPKDRARFGALIEPAPAQ